jgi:glycosyltransferase involved in cell wall biosynthesis
MAAKGTTRAGRGRAVLYLLTTDTSSVLVRGQLDHLAAAGWSVIVGVRRDRGAAFDTSAQVVDVPFVREPSLLHDVIALAHVLRLIRTIRPDVVNASTPKAGLLGMLGAWLLRVPRRVYVVRGLRFETATGVRRSLYRNVERVAAWCATDVVFNSRSLRDVAVRNGIARRSHTAVLAGGSGNGVDPARFADLPSRADARTALGIRADATVVGFVGRFTRDKGLSDAVHAFRAIAASRPHLVLLLVGDLEQGDRPDDATISAITTDPRVVRTGWLLDLRVAYAAMDVLVFPSFREGLPNAPLEAQLCGVPVVGYAATGTVDAVLDGTSGVLVPTGRRDDLAGALARVVDDDVERHEMGAAGARWVREQFAPERVWDALVHTYEGVGRPTRR